MLRGSVAYLSARAAHGRKYDCVPLRIEYSDAQSQGYQAPTTAGQAVEGGDYRGQCKVNSGHPIQPAGLPVKAAFFDYFLCSSKESDPPAGEAATE
jgi:hypothetical protein